MGIHFGPYNRVALFVKFVIRPPTVSETNSVAASAPDNLIGVFYRKVRAFYELLYHLLFQDVVPGLPGAALTSDGNLPRLGNVSCVHHGSRSVSRRPLLTLKGRTQLPPKGCGERRRPFYRVQLAEVTHSPSQSLRPRLHGETRAV